MLNWVHNNRWERPERKGVAGANGLRSKSKGPTPSPVAIHPSWKPCWHTKTKMWVAWWVVTASKSDWSKFITEWCPVQRWPGHGADFETENQRPWRYQVGLGQEGHQDQHQDLWQPLGRTWQDQYPGEIHSGAGQNHLMSTKLMMWLSLLLLMIGSRTLDSRGKTGQAQKSRFYPQNVGRHLNHLEW